eukprot:gene16933-biopygen5081
MPAARAPIATLRFTKDARSLLTPGGAGYRLPVEPLAGPLRRRALCGYTRWIQAATCAPRSGSRASVYAVRPVRNRAWTGLHHRRCAQAMRVAPVHPHRPWDPARTAVRPVPPRPRSNKEWPLSAVP